MLPDRYFDAGHGISGDVELLRLELRQGDVALITVPLPATGSQTLTSECGKRIIYTITNVLKMRA